MQGEGHCPLCRLLVLHEVIKRVCRAFDVTQRNLMEGAAQGKENMVRLMAISLCVEFSEMPLRDVAGFFPGETAETVGRARVRLQKYLRFIPGLNQKYRRLRKQAGRIQKDCLS